MKRFLEKKLKINNSSLAFSKNQKPNAKNYLTPFKTKITLQLNDCANDLKEINYAGSNGEKRNCILP